MPFRFRKTFKLGKGLKLNLSKSGFSASIGKPGATLNLGKRGPHLTTGIPGTGISHTSNLSSSVKTPPKSGAVKYVGQDSKSGGCLSFPFQLIASLLASLKDPQKSRSAFILLGSILGSCLLCFGAFSILGKSDPSNTPTPQLSNEDIINNAVRGIQDSFEQTAAAVPTLTPAPTDTFTPQPTGTVSPTPTITPTATLIPLPTATIVIILPTQPPPQAICPCSGDTLNCSDFSSHNSAQACFNYCIQQGAGDIHRLDSNNDGNACESLP